MLVNQKRKLMSAERILAVKTVDAYATVSTEAAGRRVATVERERGRNRKLEVAGDRVDSVERTKKERRKEWVVGASNIGFKKFKGISRQFDMVTV